MKEQQFLTLICSSVRVFNKKIVCKRLVQKEAIKKSNKDTKFLLRKTAQIRTPTKILLNMHKDDEQLKG